MLDIDALAQRLADTWQVLEHAKAVTGLGTYAATQIDHPDIVAEAAAVQTAIIGMRDWIAANMPHDANGYLLRETYDAWLNRVPRTFPSAATAGLRTAIDSLLATVE